MATIDERYFKIYQDGTDRMSAAEYMRDRETFRLSINDLEDRLSRAGLDQVEGISANLAAINDAVNQSIAESTNLNEQTAEQLEDIIATVQDIRDNGTGIDAKAREDIQKTTAALAEMEYQKANKSDVANALSATPLFANTLAEMTDKTRAYVLLTDGYIYLYNSSNNIFEKTNKQYQTTGIGENTVTLPSVTFSPVTGGEKSKNLFNKETVIKSKYIASINGNTYDSQTGLLNATDFIEVLPNEKYTVSHSNQGALYDENKQFISGLDRPTNVVYTFLTPSNAKYVRMSIHKDYLDIYQLEHGDAPTDFKPYGYVIPENYIDDGMIKSKSITEESLKDPLFKPKKVSRNLFNKNSVTMFTKKFVDPGTGVLGDSQSGNYNATDFIEIEPETTYTINHMYRTAFYDIYKNYIIGIDPTTPDTVQTFTTPKAAKYIRTSIHKNNFEKFQLELGNVAHPYEPFGWWIEEEQLSPSVLEKINNSSDLPFGLTNKTGPYLYNTDIGLNYWRSQLAKVSTKTGNIINVTILGSSSMEGAFAGDNGAVGDNSGNKWFTHGFVGRTRKALADKYGDVGSGVIPHYYNNAKKFWSFTGTWEDLHGSFGFTSVHKLTKTIGSTATITFEGNGFVFLTSAGTAGGNFTVSIDGGTPIELSSMISGESILCKEHVVKGLSDGTHTAILTFTGGTQIRFFGGYPLKGTNGVRVNMCARYGSTVNESTPIESMAASLDYLKPALTIMGFGSNDYALQKPLDVFKSQMQTLITRAKLYGDVIVMLPSLRHESTATIPYTAYNNALKELAIQNDIAFIDLVNRWGGDFLTARDRYQYLSSDGVHANDYGHQDIANALINTLLS